MYFSSLHSTFSTITYRVLLIDPLTFVRLKSGLLQYFWLSKLDFLYFLWEVDGRKSFVFSEALGKAVI